jgi:hypothetical protein
MRIPTFKNKTYLCPQLQLNMRIKLPFIVSMHYEWLCFAHKCTYEERTIIF